MYGRITHGLCAAAIAFAVTLAGCSDTVEPLRTEPLARGTTQSAKGYLNDAANLAATIRDFTTVLQGAGEAITPAEAKAMAPKLSASSAQARALCNRLSSQRLDDSRLEAQRAAVAPPLNRVCTSMESIARLAQEGNVRQLAARAGELPALIEDVRARGLT